MYAESVQLRVDIKVDAGAVTCRSDDRIKHTRVESKGEVGTVIIRAVGTCCRSNTEDIDVTCTESKDDCYVQHRFSG